MKEVPRTDELRLLGTRIRELRKERLVTQEQLAKRSGVHRQFVGAIERDRTNPTMRALKKIAGALEVSVADLFRYDPHTVDPKQVRKLLVDHIRRSSDSEVLLLTGMYDLIRRFH